jgi:putative tricarboxylic transport membrane protein
MKANTFLLGLVMLAAGLAVFASSWWFSPLPNQAYGSDTMPRAVGIFGLGIGAALVIQALAAGQRLPRLEILDWATDPRRVGGMAVAILGVLAYVMFSKAVGFLPVAFLLLLALMLLRGTRPALAIPIALAAAILVQQLFGRFLLVPLPRSGFLGFLW